MISIVIPVLNEEKLLSSCLQSLQEQDYTGEFEIIVADNGSTDRSMEIARSFGVNIISCPEKKSVFYAREVGASIAKGEIIVQADADTIYPDGWLNRIADKFAANPGIVAVSGRFMYRDPPRWALLEYGFRDIGNRVTSLFAGRPLLVSGATFAFRQREFLAVNGYRGITYSADQYGIARRLSKIGKVAYDPKLRVKTSSRTVAKPFGRVLAEGLWDVAIWALALLSFFLAAMRTVTAGTPRRRFALRASIPAACLAFFVIYGYFIPVSPVFGKVYYKGPPADNIIALTFDDGPNEPYTSRILDILDRYDIKATFFLIGKNIEQYPDVGKRMLAGGQVIGNHSYSHNANHALTEFGAKDLLAAQSTIIATLGVSPHLYRPPHGRKSPWEIRAVEKAGLIEITWSVSTRELAGKTSSEMARDIIANTDPGEIILLHDGYGTEHDSARADKSATVQMLPEIIEQLQSKGFRFVTVPELLGVPAYNN